MKCLMARRLVYLKVGISKVGRHRVTLGFLKPLRHSSHAKNVKKKQGYLFPQCVCVYVHMCSLGIEPTYLCILGNHCTLCYIPNCLGCFVCIPGFLLGCGPCRLATLWAHPHPFPVEFHWHRFATTVWLHLTHLIPFGQYSNSFGGVG